MVHQRLIGALLAAVLLAGCSVAGAVATPTPTLPTGVVTFSQSAYSCASIAGTGTGGPTTKWTAALSDRAGGLKVTAALAKKSGSGEAVVDQSDMAVSNPDANQLSANGVRVSLLCNSVAGNVVEGVLVLAGGQGDYVMRLVRPSDSKVLATGTFTITP